MENERFSCRDQVLSRHHASRRERSPPPRSPSRTLESSLSCNVHACDWFAFDILFTTGGLSENDFIMAAKIDKLKPETWKTK